MPQKYKLAEETPKYKLADEAPVVTPSTYERMAEFFRNAPVVLPEGGDAGMPYTGHLPIAQKSSDVMEQLGLGDPAAIGRSLGKLTPLAIGAAFGGPLGLLGGALTSWAGSTALGTAGKSVEHGLKGESVIPSFGEIGEQGIQSGIEEATGLGAQGALTLGRGVVDLNTVRRILSGKETDISKLPNWVYRNIMEHHGKGATLDLKNPITGKSITLEEILKSAVESRLKGSGISQTKLKSISADLTKKLGREATPDEFANEVFKVTGKKLPEELKLLPSMIYGSQHTAEIEAGIKGVQETVERTKKALANEASRIRKSAGKYKGAEGKSKSTRHGKEPVEATGDIAKTFETKVKEDVDLLDKHATDIAPHLTDPDYTFYDPGEVAAYQKAYFNALEKGEDVSKLVPPEMQRITAPIDVSDASQFIRNNLTKELSDLKTNPGANQAAQGTIAPLVNQVAGIGRSQGTRLPAQTPMDFTDLATIMGSTQKPQDPTYYMTMPDVKTTIQGIQDWIKLNKGQTGATAIQNEAIAQEVVGRLKDSLKNTYSRNATFSGLDPVKGFDDWWTQNTKVRNLKDSEVYNTLLNRTGPQEKSLALFDDVTNQQEWKIYKDTVGKDEAAKVLADRFFDVSTDPVTGQFIPQKAFEFLHDQAPRFRDVFSPAKIKEFGRFAHLTRMVDLGERVIGQVPIAERAAEREARFLAPLPLTLGGGIMSPGAWVTGIRSANFWMNRKFMPKVLDSPKFNDLMIDFAKNGKTEQERFRIMKAMERQINRMGVPFMKNVYDSITNPNQPEQQYIINPEQP